MARSPRPFRRSAVFGHLETRVHERAQHRPRRYHPSDRAGQSEQTQRAEGARCAISSIRSFPPPWSAHTRARTGSKYQLLGRDARVAFKHAPHEEAYADATRVIIQDQEEAGLDIVTDGQMYFDDYIGSIGSFCWYMYERIPEFDPAKEEHPAAVDAATMTKEILLLSDWGGVVNSGPIGEQAPLRLVDFYKLAKRHATSRSRSRSAPGRSTSPGTSISSITRTRAICPSRWRRCSIPR